MTSEIEEGSLKLVVDKEAVTEFEEILMQVYREYYDDDVHPGSRNTLVELLSRSKYDPTIQSRERAATELLLDVPGHFGQLYQAIRSLERPFDSYNVRVTQKGAVVYCTLNPRKAYRGVAQFTTQFVQDMSMDEDQRDVRGWNPTDLIHAIRKAPSERVFIVIDVDTLDPKDIQKIPWCVAPPVMCIRTHGGYHVVYLVKDVSQQECRAFHAASVDSTYETTDRLGQKIKATKFSLHTDPACPVPGTLQGGFLVHLVSIDSVTGYYTCQ